MHAEDQPVLPDENLPPPPGENATPEEKDRYWFEHVYRGDQPQLTWRAVLIGGLIGMPLAVSNLYTSVKLGWAFGVAITACVMAYTMGTLMKAFGAKPLSMLENNCMQSAASAAGYSTGGTVGSAFGALLLLQGTHQPWYVLAPFVMLTALLGVFLAVPFKRQMINHEQLAFPGGIAAATTTRSLYAQGADAIRKARVLLLALAVGAAIGFLLNAPAFLNVAGLEKAAEWMGAHVHTEFTFPAEWAIPATIGVITVLEGFAFEYSIVMLAAGVVTGLRVGISMLISAAVLYFILTPWLLQTDLETANASLTPAAYDTMAVLRKMISGDPYTVLVMPRKWGMWTGTAILVFASLTSVALQWKSILRAFTGLKAGSGNAAQDAAMAAVEVPGSWMKMGLIPITLALVILQSVFFDISWWLGLISVAMSFVVALVCCRSTGETDTTPIGAMGKLTQLLYSVLPGAHGNSVINLSTAGLTSAAGSSAADLLTDLKSGYLLGANPRKQFIAQLSGVFFGTLAVVPFWYLLCPDKEALEKLGAPAATMWKATADLLAGGIGKLPPSALYGAAIGAVLGILIPLIEKFAPKTRSFMPSTMGLGLGLVMPFANAFSFFMGGLVAWVWGKYRPLGFKEYGIAVASGLISGGALMEAFSAILQTMSGLMGAK